MLAKIIKQRANDILQEVNESISVTIPIPIEEVIKTYLVDVNINFLSFFHTPLSNVSAFAKKDMQDGWLIVVNSAESRQRQRFSQAHELAHIVLMPNKPDPVYCAQVSSSADEKLCDRFAGDILIPNAALVAFYQEHPRPYLENVAEYFDVSPLVAQIQLQRLGLPFRRMILATVSGQKIPLVVSL